MDINELRILLDRFYDGTSTPEDIEALRRFFSETKDIPVDLRPDAAIFTSNVPAEIPSAEEILGTGFLTEIEKAANEEVSASGTEKVRITDPLPRWTVWASIAAAACIAAVLFFRYPSGDSFRLEPQDNISGEGTEKVLTARVAAGLTEIDTIAYAATINTPTEETDVVPASKATNVSRQNNRTERAATQADVSDGYIEINDSAQAAYYINLVCNKIDNSLDVVNKSVRDVDRHLDESIVTISTTLKNL